MTEITSNDALQPSGFGRNRALSLSYYTVPELDALQTVDLASATECHHVGLRLLGGQPGGSEMPLMTNQALRRQMIQSMAASGITPLDANTARLVPDTRTAQLLPMLDVAAELGARHVLTTVDDPEDQRVIDNLIALGDAALERSLTIDIEFVPWLQISNLDKVAGLIDRCNHQALGIAIDALHAYRSHSEIKQLAKIPVCRFRYLQLCDAPWLFTQPSRENLIHEAVNERLLPGQGDIDLAAILKSLPASLPIALEIPQQSLAATVPAKERVEQAIKATCCLLNQVYP